MAQRTIEDLFQYRIHRILTELHKKYEDDKDTYSDKRNFDQWLWTHRDELGSAVLEDIESYCGLDEALKNEG